MLNKIKDDDNLKTVLDQLDNRLFDQDPRQIKQVRKGYHYLLSESLKNRLEAKAKDTGKVIYAQMPFTTPSQAYTIETGSRKIDIVLNRSVKGNLVSASHYVFDLKERGRVCGEIHQFPNLNFDLSNDEPCNRLMILNFEETQYIMYVGEISRNWFSVTPFSVTLNQSQSQIATITDADSLFSRKRYLKCHQTLSAELVGLLMAMHNGLVFRYS